MPSSATQQCLPPVPPISATQQLRPSVPPVSAFSQCPSLLHISAASSVPPHQCPPVPSHQCHLISAAYQCPSVLPIHATSSVPISAHQCCLSVQPHQRTSV
ncbi:unnamed protein product, partial [Staurois parvus]